MRPSSPTDYLARVADVRITARHGSERVGVAIRGEGVQLERSDIPHLIRVLREAHARSAR
ncbi:MAG: hypothetical protein ACRDK9_13975 [Solirubrobacterales bacterium]